MPELSMSLHELYMDAFDWAMVWKRVVSVPHTARLLQKYFYRRLWCRTFGLPALVPLADLTDQMLAHETLKDWLKEAWVPNRAMTSKVGACTQSGWDKTQPTFPIWNRTSRMTPCMTTMKPRAQHSGYGCLCHQLEVP